MNHINLIRYDKRGKYVHQRVMHKEAEAKLSIFEKCLTLWIAMGIIIGLLLGRILPPIGSLLNSIAFAESTLV